MGSRRGVYKRQFNLPAVLLVLVMLVTYFVPAGIMGPNMAAAETASHVVISELYGGGGNSGSYWKQDFIELYNPTDTAVSLDGWSVQYASAKGTSWQVTELNGIIAPHGFYLVQEGQGSKGSADLPSPNATGKIFMSATAGKVALVKGSEPVTGKDDQKIVDLVGFGATASFYEGSGSAPAPSNTASIERKANNGSDPTGDGADLGNGWDTNDNAADFVVRQGAANIQPQNSSKTAEPGDQEQTPAGQPVIIHCEPTGAITDTKPKINATFSWGEGAGPGSVLLQLDGSTVANAYNGGGPYNISYTPGVDLVSGEHAVSFTVYNDQNEWVNKSWHFTISAGDNNPPAPTPGVTPINQVDMVNADGIPTRLNEDNITVEGVVTAGTGVLDAGKTIYIQDATGGIAVYKSGLPPVKQGDKVRVSGKLTQYSGLTELTPSGSIQVLSSGNALPQARTTTLADLNAFSTAEPLEGTLVKVEAKLVSIPTGPDKGGGYNIQIADADGNNGITMRVMGTTGIDPSTVWQAGKTYEITGIVGQYARSSPYTGGYQIFPRAADDILEKKAAYTEDKPLIYGAHPANMAFTYDRTPEITAAFEKGGADINPLSVQITLDGQSVKDAAYVGFDADKQQGVISYTPAADLSYGEHDVTVSVTDAAYKSTEYTWYFVVDDGVATPNFYYGVPHAHTSFSDGQGTPADAYKHAYEKGLDFLVITDHSNSLEGDQYDSKAREFLSQPGSEWARTNEMAQAFNNAHPGKFLAMRGFEMTSSDWGHINVHNTDSYVEAKKTMTALSDFYHWLEQKPNAVAEFNHPGWPSDSFNNLGYVPEVDRMLNLIEVGNGAPPYSYTRYEDYYYRALDNGWHVGAINAQDNHSMNWGDPDNLTVIVADQLTKDEFLEAMRERRVYSTETRTLKLTMKANGYWMGSELDLKPGEKLHFDITASDKGQPIDKLELVTNGGKVIDSKPVGGQTDVSWQPVVTPGMGANWYVVKVTHTNGKLGFSSPIFTAGGENDVKLVELKINPEPSLPNYSTTLTATVANMGVRPADNLEVRFYQGANNGDLIGTGTIAHLGAGEKQNVEVTWKPGTAGQTRIFAVLTGIPGVTTVTELSRTLNVVAANGKKVLVDQAHNNSEVPGTHNDLMELLRRYGYNASFNTSPLTAGVLKGVDVLILNTPTDYNHNLTPAEMDTIAAWVKAGGSLLVAGKSNFQFEGTAQNKYGDGCTMLNPLLGKMGSGIRLNNDNVYEPNSSKNFSGGMKWSVYARTIPPASSGLNSDLEAIRYFSGCSLVDKNLKALKNDPAHGLEILVAGNKTSYNYNVQPGYYSYNEATGDENDPAQGAGPNGDKIPLIAKEDIGAGRLVVAGRYFYSDYEIVNDVSNTAFTLRLVDWLANNSRIRSIAEVRQNAKPGEILTVGGVVTAPTGNFFDTVYIQDATGGIALYGTQGRELPVGTAVIATGGVQSFEGEAEQAYQNSDLDVLYVGPGKAVQPVKLSPKEAMLPQYTGMLIQTGGKITEVNEPASYFKVDDGSGAAYIHVEGYLGVDMSRLKPGELYTVTGIASVGAAGPRVRVRFPDDVQAGYSPPGNGGSENSGGGSTGGSGGGSSSSTVSGSGSSSGTGTNTGSDLGNNAGSNNSGNGTDTNPPVSSVTFADIAGHWAQKDIELLAGRGVIHGVTKNKFAPQTLVTRAEFAAMLVNALGITETGNLPFKDVPDGSWYHDAVARAYTAGLVKGAAVDKFNPGAQISRQEMAAMVVRAMGKAGRDLKTGDQEAKKILSHFKDQHSIAPWAEQVLAVTVREKIISGRSDGRLAPKASATRAEAVVIIKRLLQLAGMLN